MNNIPNKNDKKSIKEMFENISKNYDFLNGCMTLFTHRLIRKSALSLAKSNPEKILDVCTGTGDTAILTAEKFPNSQITAIDFSPSMLALAKKKAKKHPNICFLEADATNLPFENNSFDLCTISFGLRNLPDIKSALKEFFRILKPSGQLIILDTGKPSKFITFFIDLIVPILGKIFHGKKIPYQYLAKSIKTYPTPSKIISILEEIGYVSPRCKDYNLEIFSAQTAFKP